MPMSVLLLSALLLLAAVVPPPAHAAKRVAPEEFLISFWCGPSPEETTAERYREIAAAGFNAVLPPCSGPVTPELNQRILALCAQNGLKAVVSDPRLEADAASSGGEAALDAVVAEYGKSPALLGYFLGDEPSAAGFPRLAALDQGLRRRDPKRLPFMNLFPNYASPEQLGTTSYPEYVRRFMETVQPKLLSFDHYALLQRGERPAYFENLEVIRREALRAKTPFASIVLATPHDPYRDPTEADLRWQVYTSLAYGARGILYFTYWTPKSDVWNFHNGILDEAGRQTPHYAQVQRINGELNALARTLVELRSEGVYHAGGLPAGTRGLPPGATVREVTGGDAVVGLFREPVGVRVKVGVGVGVRRGSVGIGERREPEYLLLVNRDMRRSARLQVALQPAIEGMSEISRRSGRAGRLLTPDLVAANVFTVRLAAGDGRLFKLIERRRDDWPTPERGIGVGIGGVSVGIGQ
jgi:hypothetical protein